MIGVSLVVCSLDRVIPLYKGLKNQRVEKSTSFIERQRIAVSKEIQAEEKEEWLKKWQEVLSKHRYHVRRENDSLLAEKGRFSRWGPLCQSCWIDFIFAFSLVSMDSWMVH